uniref:Uncharacterized protein n=1 Tax=Plectus sambesii TaxID=2011161 RepID=A0A914WSZ9_9BILA
MRTTNALITTLLRQRQQQRLSSKWNIADVGRKQVKHSTDDECVKIGGESGICRERGTGRAEERWGSLLAVGPGACRSIASIRRDAHPRPAPSSSSTQHGHHETLLQRSYRQ